MLILCNDELVQIENFLYNEATELVHVSNASAAFTDAVPRIGNVRVVFLLPTGTQHSYISFQQDVIIGDINFSCEAVSSISLR